MPGRKRSDAPHRERRFVSSVYSVLSQHQRKQPACCERRLIAALFLFLLAFFGVFSPGNRRFLRLVARYQQALCRFFLRQLADDLYCRMEISSCA